MFFEDFSDLLERYACVPGDLILTGDFNFHFEDADNAGTARLREILQTYNMIQHVQEPTHECGHMLDLCISRSETSVQGASVEDLISDHHIIQCSLSVGRPAFPREDRVYRKVKSIDKAAFARDLAASDLMENPCSDLSGLVDQYNSALSTLLDVHAPLKKKTLIIRPDAPWLDKDILDARKVRRQLERHWRSSRLTVDLDRFKDQRKHVKNMITAAKSQHHTGEINEHASDLNALFRVTNSIMGTKKATVLPDHESLPTLLESFNEFFVQKIQLIRRNMDQTGQYDSAHGIPVAVACHTSAATVPALSAFVPATVEEVGKLIRQSPTKSCGLDPVPTWLLKQHSEGLIPVITNIVNMSMATGLFPEQFKAAKSNTVAMVTLLLVCLRCMYMYMSPVPDGLFTYRNHGDRAWVR